VPDEGYILPAGLGVIASFGVYGSRRSTPVVGATSPGSLSPDTWAKPGRVDEGSRRAKQLTSASIRHSEARPSHVRDKLCS
jgi:hypothetical protein